MDKAEYQNEDNEGDCGNQTIQKAAEISCRPGGGPFDRLEPGIFFCLELRRVWYTLAPDEKTVRIDRKGRAGDERAIVVLALNLDQRAVLREHRIDTALRSHSPYSLSERTVGTEKTPDSAQEAQHRQ